MKCFLPWKRERNSYAGGKENSAKKSSERNRAEQMDFFSVKIINKDRIMFKGQDEKLRNVCPYNEGKID